jgi:hypothetical protein
MKTPTYKDRTVGCAASAIVFSLAKTGFYGTNLKNHISGAKGQKNWLEKANELQNKLKWSNTVLVSQIGDFVQIFPEYRIVIVDLALKSSQASDWKGSDYFPNGAKSIIYLHYNTIDMHFQQFHPLRSLYAEREKIIIGAMTVHLISLLRHNFKIVIATCQTKFQRNESKCHASIAGLITGKELDISATTPNADHAC